MPTPDRSPTRAGSSYGPNLPSAAGTDVAQQPVELDIGLHPLVHYQNP